MSYLAKWLLGNSPAVALFNPTLHTVSLKTLLTTVWEPFCLRSAQMELNKLWSFNSDVEYVQTLKMPQLITCQGPKPFLLQLILLKPALVDDAEEEFATLLQTRVCGSRLIAPTALQSVLISLARVGHQGEVRTKQCLRDLYWWPDAQVHNAVRCCQNCQVTSCSSPTSASARRTMAESGCGYRPVIWRCCFRLQICYNLS